MLCLAKVYGPNNDSPMFFSNFFNDFNNFSSYDVILGGDFNLILNNNLDKMAVHLNTATTKLVRLFAPICGQ